MNGVGVSLARHFSGIGVFLPLEMNQFYSHLLSTASVTTFRMKALPGKEIIKALKVA
jgi:hypothetical protein